MSLVVLCLLGLTVSLVTGQPRVYFSLGSTNITTNNTEILITDIGEDISGGLPSLTCNTDLTACCRNIDTVDGMAAGEWYYPNGSVVKRSPDARAAGDPFYRVRNAAQVARLARRISLNPLSPTGSYCCVIPTTGGEMNFCANLVVCPSLTLTNGMISYSDPTLGAGSVATHTCDSGYALTTAENTRTCEDIGGWSGSALTSCADFCFDIPPPHNRHITYNGGSPDSRPLGTTATYSCDGTTRTCQGIWTESAPGCSVTCLDLSPPPNGNINYNQGSVDIRPVGTVATYSCDTGYMIVGDETTICKVDRTWSSITPTCESRVSQNPKIDLGTHTDRILSFSEVGPGGNTQPVEPLICTTSNIDNAIWRFPNWTNIPEGTSGTATGSQLFTRRIPGFGVTLHRGPDYHSPDGQYCCVRTGTNERRCVTLMSCPTLRVLTHGMITYDAVTNTATTVCNKGHMVPRNMQITCNEDTMQWSAEQPPCVVVFCGNPPTIDNGSRTFSGTRYQDTATYSCHTGYQLSIPIGVTCQASGSWSTPPACIGHISQRPNINSRGYTGHIRSFSDVGPGGNDINIEPQPFVCVLSNTDDVVWQFPNGTNIPTGPETGGANGSQLFTRNIPGFGVTLHRGPDYLSPDGEYCCVRIGTDERRCVTLTPCPPLRVLGLGLVTYNAATNTATTTCNEGVAVVVENRQIFCNEETMQWSAQQPPCLAICLELTLDNGMISYEPENTGPKLHGHMATHSCDIGYELAGGTDRVCHGLRGWSGESITCEAVDCGPPSVPSNGQVNLTPPGSTTFNSFATYSCDPTCYELEGISFRICGGDGNWVPDAPVCNIVSDCGPPPPLMNGAVQTSPNTGCGSVATYSCDSGYELVGQSEHTCQPDGQWNGELPVCIAVNCGPLSQPVNGRCQLDMPPMTTFMSTATCSCNTGYELTSNASLCCGADGQWKPSPPTCDPVECGSLSLPVNGQVEKSCTTFMCVATYICDTCYDLIGERSRECTADGVWSHASPTCQIVDCGPLAPPENGLVNTEPGTTCSQQATYSCLEGYILTGSPTRTCTPNGQWSPTAPICTPVDCGELQVPSNGHVDTSNGTHYQSIATYSCDPGYNLTGCPIAECLSNRSWSSNPPFCADNEMIQLKVGPARRCDEWTDEKVELMYFVMQSSIQKAIQSSGHVIPKENVQPGYFSCYRSTTETTYRTTITGTERVSAVDYAALIQQWVDSGVTTRVLWYVIKFDKTCPVSISSMDDDECE